MRTRQAETAILASLQALRVFCWGQNWMWEEWHLGAHGRPPLPRCPVCLLSKQALYGGGQRRSSGHRRRRRLGFIISRTFQYLPSTVWSQQRGCYGNIISLDAVYLLIYSDIREVCQTAPSKLKVLTTCEVLLNHSPEEIIYQLFTVGVRTLLFQAQSEIHQPKIWKRAVNFKKIKEKKKTKKEKDFKNGEKKTQETNKQKTYKRKERKSNELYFSMKVTWGGGIKSASTIFTQFVFNKQRCLWLSLLLISLYYSLLIKVFCGLGVKISVEYTSF